MQISGKLNGQTHSTVKKCEIDVERDLSQEDLMEPQLVEISSGTVLPTQKVGGRGRLGDESSSLPHQDMPKTGQSYSIDPSVETSMESGDQNIGTGSTPNESGYVGNTDTAFDNAVGVNPDTVQGINSKLDQTEAQSSTAKKSDKPDQNGNYGLHGLAEIVRMSNKDANMLAFGCDSIGQNVNPEKLSSWKLFSPFVDVQPNPSVYEPENNLNILLKRPKGVPPAIKNMPSYSDETLFYLFYTLTRDVLQEAAAQELYSRNWRFHKELKLWLSRDLSSKSVKGVGFERSVFVFFDPGIWSYVKKEWVLHYSQLEERNSLSI